MMTGCSLRLKTNNRSCESVATPATSPWLQPEGSCSQSGTSSKVNVLSPTSITQPLRLSSVLSVLACRIARRGGTSSRSEPALRCTASSRSDFPGNGQTAKRRYATLVANAPSLAGVRLRRLWDRTRTSPMANVHHQPFGRLELGLVVDITQADRVQLDGARGQ